MAQNLSGYKTGFVRPGHILFFVYCLEIVMKELSFQVIDVMTDYPSIFHIWHLHVVDKLLMSGYTGYSFKSRQL